MADKIKMRGHDFYCSIFESELQLIAATSAEWGDLETGGDLYGFHTHGGRAVVLLALPAGPKAIHEATHFAQDIEHFNRISPILADTFGLQLDGMHHSHHGLGLDEPSPGDVRQVQSITSKNNIKCWLEIIATHRDGNGISGARWDQSPTPCCPGKRAWFERTPDIRINSFFYVNAPAGEKVRCPIKVIPGVSPIRQALIGNGVLTNDELGFQGWQFPMEKILFDATTPTQPDAADGRAVPEELTGQLCQLPPELRHAATIMPDDPFFIVSLPLARHVDARIAFNSETSRPIQAVYLSDDRQDRPQDVTERLFRTARCTSIAQVYARLRSLLGNAARPVAGCGRSTGTKTDRLRSVETNVSPSQTGQKEVNPLSSRST